MSRIQSGQKGPPFETVMRMFEILTLDGTRRRAIHRAYSNPRRLPERWRRARCEELIQSLEHAAADLESASRQLRGAIAVLTRIAPPHADESQ